MQFATETTNTVPPVVSTMLPMGAVAHTATPEAAPAHEATKKGKKISEDQVQKVVRDINEQLQSIQTDLKFSVDKSTGKMVLKIVNSKTEEVVRQIPGEDALRLSTRISKLLGFIVDWNA